MSERHHGLVVVGARPDDMPRVISPPKALGTLNLELPGLYAPNS